MKMTLFNVAPFIPDRVRFLETLACNTWWCWQPEAVGLFRRINPQLWKECEHNPFTFLSRVAQKRLEALASDEGFLRQLDEAQELFQSSMGAPEGGWSVNATPWPS